jgi:hypothetical protein
MLTRWFFSRGSHVCQHASPRCVDRSLGGSVANRCFTNLAHMLGTTRTYPKSEGSSMTHSTRVALRGSHGVRTIPLTNPSPEPRTIFTRASQRRPQSTKTSRWWQSPRVTRNPQSQRFSSATKCKSSNAHTRSLNPSLKLTPSSRGRGRGRGGSSISHPHPQRALNLS